MIGALVASCLRFRPLVITAAAALMVVGAARLQDMPVDVIPEISPATVQVQTEALGLSAAEVEQLITVPIEADLLTGTPWVDVMRSESVPGLSSIELTFKPGTNPMHARQVVQERLTQAHALPNVSRPPRMLQPLSSTNRVLLIGLSSKTQSLIDLSVLSRWTIRPRLMGVPGVANVAIWGQRERQLQVQVDPKRLAEKNVSLIQIVKTTGNSLWYSPLTFLEASVAGTGGFIETPNQRLGVRHVLPISVAGDLAKVPVEGTSIPLGDVAKVVEDHQPLIGDGLNGEGAGLLLVVEKLPGVNTLQVTREIDKALDALKPGLGGIEFDRDIYRPAGYVRTAMNNVGIALLLSLILVAVALLAMFHNWRAALVGLLTIPVSLMAAILVIQWTGATLNAMVLAGLVIALGVVIDEAIVLTESVLTRLRAGSDPSLPRVFLAAVTETHRPLLFATAIVLLALVPVLFVTGAAGALIQPMVLSYAAGVLASLVVAITFTPALGLMLFRMARTVGEETPFSGWVKGLSERMSPMVPRAAVALAIVATLAAVAATPRLRAPIAPEFKESDVMIKWDAEPGTSRAEMTRMIDRVSKELRSVPGVRNVGSHVGRAILSDQVVGVNSSELWVSLDPKADHETAMETIEDVVAGYPGVEAEVTTYIGSRMGEALNTVDEPIIVRVYGQRHDVIRREAEKVRQALAGISGIVDPSVNLDFNEPVVEIEVKLDAAQARGVKPGDVRRAAATLLAGIEVGNLFEEQKMFEVVVWSEPHVRHSLSAIHDLLIDAPGGRHVRLGDVATVRIVPHPNVIERENVARTVDVVAFVKGRSVPAVAADVSDRIRQMSFPLEYRAELQGDYAKQQRAVNRMLMAALAAAICILVVLQAALGGWALASAVLLSLPVALAGGVLAALTTGSALSVGALAGLLTVFGITVRQAVLLIHRYHALRKQGRVAGPELVLQGIRDRATPILAAAITTAAAMIPFVVWGSTPGHEIVGPLAIVILGGLITSTVYVMCLVPALYARLGAGVAATAPEDDDLNLASLPEFQRV
ncbi:MAG TPA: efflux RND transporter permease subunit [Verrucomicrobiae bacterium]|nr:efflux RND transporter permease subunit [Verrucomicrobiae bacterium]